MYFQISDQCIKIKMLLVFWKEFYITVTNNLRQISPIFIPTKTNQPLRTNILLKQQVPFLVPNLDCGT